MTTKQKIAEILAARDNLPVDCIIDQLDQMIEEMREAADGEDWGANDLAVEGIWEEWAGLEPDHLAGVIMEDLL